MLEQSKIGVEDMEDKKTMNHRMIHYIWEDNDLPKMFLGRKKISGQAVCEWEWRNQEKIPAKETSKKNPGA